MSRNSQNPSYYRTSRRPGLGDVVPAPTTVAEPSQSSLAFQQIGGALATLFAPKPPALVPGAIVPAPVSAGPSFGTIAIVGAAAIGIGYLFLRRRKAP